MPGGKAMVQIAPARFAARPRFVVARHSPAPAGVGLPEREARTPKGPQGAERPPLHRLCINISLHPSRVLWNLHSKLAGNVVPRFGSAVGEYDFE